MKPAHLKIDWSNVLEMALDDRERLADLDLFSLDLGSVVTVRSVTAGVTYSLTVADESASVLADRADTAETIATKLIDAVNRNSNLTLLVKALPAPRPEEKSVRDHTWFGAKTNKQLEIRSLHCFSFFPVSANPVGDLIVYQKKSEPIRLGGRSKILEQAANQTLVYRNSRDLFWAQANLAAHFAAQNLNPAAGQGTLASDSWEGEGMSFTMPSNNPRADQERLHTIFGRRFNELVKGKKVRIAMRR